MVRIRSAKHEPKKKFIRNNDDDDNEAIDTNELRFQYPLYPTSITFKPERHRKRRK